VVAAIPAVLVVAAVIAAAFVDEPDFVEP